MPNLRTLVDSGQVDIYAYGTSEGVSKAWDTRGRKRNAHAEALANAGFKHTGRDASGFHRYSKEANGFHHTVRVDPKTGQWAHRFQVDKQLGGYGWAGTRPTPSDNPGSNADTLKTYLGNRDNFKKSK